MIEMDLFLLINSQEETELGVGEGASRATQVKFSLATVSRRLQPGVDVSFPMVDSGSVELIQSSFLEVWGITLLYSLTFGLSLQRKGLYALLP